MTDATNDEPDATNPTSAADGAGAALEADARPSATEQEAATADSAGTARDDVRITPGLLLAGVIAVGIGIGLGLVMSAVSLGK